MSEYKIDGYGYEWDAELVGGPCDGLIDHVIQLEGNLPPSVIYKPLNKDYLKKLKLGEKIFEIWSKESLSDDLKLAIYKIRGKVDDYDGSEEDLKYDYLETLTAKEFKNKY